MGCGSKTRYSVASSTSPVFDMDNRINQFEAAMLDYTANSVIEYSEYMKSYYNTSRLRGYKQFINWWRKQGNEEVFGKVTATFFGNADIDNTAVAEAIKPMIDLEPTDVFRVFNTDLNFFSEDFFVRHLATEQDKTDVETAIILKLQYIHYQQCKGIQLCYRAKRKDGREYIPLSKRIRGLEIRSILLPDSRLYVKS